MATLTVPRSRKAIAKATAALATSDFEALLKALRAATAAARPTALAEVLKPGGRALQDAIEFAVEIEAARSALEISVDQAASDVAQSDVYDASPEERERVGTFLRSALQTNAVKITAKSWALLLEYERTLHSTRILSDLRPVFADTVEEGPAAWLVVHSLKLTVHEGGELKEIFIAIDSGDIEDLQAILDRARKKSHALRVSLAKTGIAEAKED
jgi:hypothetical protein